jgi:muramoyltetrapeptide carboxypeptidase
MTLVCHSIGTPYEIDTDGCILMIEDLNEEPYMVDAGLHHLIRAGKFENVKGFVFGTDVNLKENTIPEYVGSSLSIEEILDELIGPLGIPAIANLPVGHGKDMATMPLGARVRLDGAGKTLEVTEAAVTPAGDRATEGAAA